MTSSASFACVFTFERQNEKNSVLDSSRGSRCSKKLKSGSFAPACEMVLLQGGVWLNPKPFGPSFLGTMIFLSTLPRFLCLRRWRGKERPEPTDEDHAEFAIEYDEILGGGGRIPT